MSAAAKRSAINRQKLARQRMSARARGLSSPEATLTKQNTQQSQASGAMSPPLEMRVKLLPRIAEYRSKGWINEEEESDYHQLLSSKDFGDTSNQVALQVEKALDLAKAKNESTTTAAAPTNKRSLFRKQPSATSGQLTLEKKLSHRRKSRMGQAATPDRKSNNKEETKKPAIMDSKDLSIVEAMFGKEPKASTPADKRNERLERARQRRRSSFSSDPVKNKPTEPAVEKQENSSTEIEGEMSKEEPLVTNTKSHVSISAAERFLKHAKSKSVHHQPPKVSQQRVSTLEEAPTIRLSQSDSIEQQYDGDTGTKKIDHEPQRLPKTASSRSIYQRQPTKASAPQQVSMEKPPTSSLSESKSTKQQQNDDMGIQMTDQQQERLPKTASSRSIYQRNNVAKASKQGSLGEAPMISLSQSESTEQQESVETGIQKVDREPQRLQKTASSRSIYQQRAAKASATQQVSFGEAPTISLSQSESTEQQENSDTGIRQINHHHPSREAQHVLKEVPSMSGAKFESVNNSNKALICEPRDLWQKHDVQSEEALKDLFVEMAFFARLGFVQPPSCLHCVYRESIEKTSPDLCCKRFVPWRKDANVPIHPHQLDDNIVLIQCHAARSLVQGEDDVETYRWDKIRRLLVHQ